VARSRKACWTTSSAVSHHCLAYRTSAGPWVSISRASSWGLITLYHDAEGRPFHEIEEMNRQGSGAAPAAPEPRTQRGGVSGTRPPAYSARRLAARAAPLLTHSR